MRVFRTRSRLDVTAAFILHRFLEIFLARPNPDVGKMVNKWRRCEMSLPGPN